VGEVGAVYGEEGETMAKLQGGEVLTEGRKGLWLQYRLGGAEVGTSYMEEDAGGVYASMKNAWRHGHAVWQARMNDFKGK
jgi:hypothetical protein